jgi:hypothetical protein
VRVGNSWGLCPEHSQKPRHPQVSYCRKNLSGAPVRQWRRMLGSTSRNFTSKMPYHPGESFAIPQLDEENSPQFSPSGSCLTSSKGDRTSGNRLRMIASTLTLVYPQDLLWTSDPWSYKITHAFCFHSSRKLTQMKGQRWISFTH